MTECILIHDYFLARYLWFPDEKWAIAYCQRCTYVSCNVIRLYSLPVVQSGAVKPGGQAQVYMFTPSVHSSPLVQGLESHSLISVQIEFQRQWME